MIGYVTLGSNDMARAAAFYDALLGEIGAKRLWSSPGGIGWGVNMKTPSLALMAPFDGQPVSVGNGTMVALVMKETAQVDALYAKAMALGAKDEGAAGPRGSSFYGGYFRDPDGNKLCVFCIPTQA